MAPWLDYDHAYTPEEIAEHLGVDIRFLRIAENAGLTFDETGRITVRTLWEWFGTHFDKFRKTAGMRSYPLRKSLKGHELRKARFEAALMTIVEFFGCLPFERAVFTAAEVLRPRKRR